MVQALRLTEAAGDLRVSSVPFVKNAQTITPTKPGTGERGHTIVLGSSGLAGDVLCATDAVLAVGDILYFPNAGAYVQSFSPNQYLGFAQAQTYVHT
jgi:diaminopimelate decarboxylase